jgi:hypothetical protein
MLGLHRLIQANGYRSDRRLRPANQVFNAGGHFISWLWSYSWL